MEIRRYVSIIRRRLLLVVAIIAAALVAGYAITPRGRTYTATSTLYVGSRSIDLAPSSNQISADRYAGLDRLIKTFTAMVSTRPIAQAAVQATGGTRSVDAVTGSSQALQVTDTNLIHVTYTDASPSVAVAMANGVANALVGQIRGVEQRPNATDQVISMYDPARGAAPSTSGLARTLALSGIFGIIAAAALLALLEHLDITVRTSDDAERLLELPVLAVVPAWGHDDPPMSPATVREGLLRAEPPPPGGAQVG
jgi:capsular polysaccharide biosynthesis protein